MSDFRLLVSADFLKLRRRRGLVVITALLTIGAMLLLYGAFGLIALLNKTATGPRGGLAALERSTFLLALLGSVAAAVVGSTAGAGDLDARVYRDLVVTGRSRVELFASRIPAAIALLLPFVVVGYAFVVVLSTTLSGPRPSPSAGGVVEAGLWLLLDVSVYCVLSLGLASVLGSRTYAITIVLAVTLALTPLLSAIGLLGIGRVAIPGVALRDLAPLGLRKLLDQGSVVEASTIVCALVVAAWAAGMSLAGARRDVARDA